MMTAVDVDVLRDRWQRLCRTFAASELCDTSWQLLRDSYSQPHRAYHNLTHITECLAHLDSVMGIINPPRVGTSIELALWFHDAVYDTHRHDNEEASAALADHHLEHAGAPPALRAQVSRLILATKHSATPVDEDSRWIVDIDLAILGADAARFEQYEEQIRQEYDWVPSDAFREGRAAVLRKFLEREAIYGTPEFHARLENAARQNLQRSLAALAR